MKFRIKLNSNKINERKTARVRKNMSVSKRRKNNENEKSLLEKMKIKLNHIKMVETEIARVRKIPREKYTTDNNRKKKKKRKIGCKSGT